MTYEEAITCIKENICYEQEACADGICKGTEARPCAIEVAIEALESKIPKKVEWTTDHTWGVERKVPVCPTCDCYLTPIEFISADGDSGVLKASYCDSCSQALDWSEVE